MRIRLPRINAWLLWWFASLIFVLAADSRFSHSSIRVFPALHQSVLSDGADVWQLPVAFLDLTEHLAVWPKWLWISICAGVITTVIVRKQAEQSLAALLIVPALAFTLTPDTLILLLLLNAAGRKFSTAQHSSLLKTTLWKYLVLAVAVLLTLDFALVLALVVLNLVVEQSRSQSHSVQARTVLRTELVVILLIFGAAALANTGFRNAMFRPLSWLWHDTSLMPSLQSFPIAWPDRFTIAVGMGAMVVLMLQLLQSAAPFQRKLAGCLFALHGLCCGRYFAVAVATLHQLPAASQQPAHQPQNSQKVAAGGLTLAILFFAGNAWLGHISGAWKATAQTRLVDSSIWQLQGPVMLTNLDQTADWQTPAARRDFQLLLSNRWDVAPRASEHYADVVQDLRHGLREHYLNAAGRSSGYAQFLSAHQPVVIAVDSSDLDTIRQLSVEPTWRLISVDYRRTVFGNTQLPAAAALLRRAAGLLYQLECPRPNHRVQLEGVMALETAADSRAVAMVLNAMRLPYAALRVLPLDNDAETQRVRTWCYAELAHRAQRYTGQVSLLDHSRAVVRLQRLAKAPWIDFAQRELIFTVLQSLRESDIGATKIPGDRNATSSNDQDSQWQQELRFRRQLCLGELDQAAVTAKRLSSAPIREFAESLLLASEQSPGQILQRLSSIASHSGCPDRIREECLFYCGCLELELGNGRSASGYLNASQKIYEDSPFSGLRQFYLSQLKGI